MAARSLLIGIDEAGYGPVLGPLVVSAAAVEVDGSRSEQCLWRLLSNSVSRRPGSRSGHVPIADSKVLFKSKGGLSRLERSVLAMVGAWRGLPPDWRGLLALLCPQATDQLRQYPWYAGVNPSLPRAADGGGVRIAAATVSRDMESAGVRPAGMWSEMLPEGHYNRLVTGTRNKAVVLLGLTMRLIQRVSDAYPDHCLRFFIDKQGARSHYGPTLMRSFSGRRLRVVHEDAVRSEYELTAARGPWRIRFHEGGESEHLTTALASCVSKYLREIFMECFNAYWAEHAPGIRPTAGYYQDGMRFVAQVRARAGELGIDERWFVRLR